MADIPRLVASIAVTFLLAGCSTSEDVNATPASPNPATASVSPTVATSPSPTQPASSPPPIGVPAATERWCDGYLALYRVIINGFYTSADPSVAGVVADAADEIEGVIPSFEYVDDTETVEALRHVIRLARAFAEKMQREGADIGKDVSERLDTYGDLAKALKPNVLPASLTRNRCLD